MSGKNLPSLSSVVPKPWGYEYCAYDSGAAAVWILHIARGRKTSRHCHPNKHTRLIVLQGEVEFNGQKLKPLDKVEVPKGEYHQTSVPWECEPASENGAFVMEIEEPSNKADIHREDDKYGREGKPIESETLGCTSEILRLSTKRQAAMGWQFQIETVLGGPVPALMVNAGNDIIGIYRDRKERLADQVAKFVKSQGIDHIFGVVGGGSMHLNDAFRDMFVPMHHEQAASFAADAYARIRGMACCQVTTGPGGTNAVTGVACSWVDSIPVLYISGQVTTEQMMHSRDERQRGIQETDIVSIVTPITKHAVTVTDASQIRYELEKAAWIAKSGRPGPVWVDIPLDIQSKMVDWDELRAFYPPSPPPMPNKLQIDDVMEQIAAAKRPVLLYGNGIHLAKAEDVAYISAFALGVPVVTSWTAGDIMADHPLHVGHCGIFGDRASNFTVQNADLIVAIGCRMSVGQIGYRPEHFARNAKVISVNVAPVDSHARVDEWVNADAKEFFSYVKAQAQEHHGDWYKQCCLEWKRLYPMTTEGSYGFIQKLSDELPDYAIVVTDMGTSFTCTFQAAKMKPGQRWFTASGHAPMGYGLPGAIGAHYASGKRITCLVGDGALQFNIQELATVRAGKLPIDIHVISNGGYLTMKHTQANHFGRFVGATEDAGLFFPSVEDLEKTYGVPIHEFKMDPMQPLIPRVSSVKLPDGSVTSRPLEDMYPFLPRDEFRAQMIVPPLEEIG